MRTIPPALATHIAQTVTSLVACVKITRRDGTVLGFTEHDVDLDIGGVVYEAKSGYSPSQIAQKGNLSVDNLQYSAILDSDTLSHNDLLWGVYDGARIEMFLVDHENPTNGIIVVASGSTGEVSLADTMFETELRSLSQHLSAVIGRVVQRECDVPVFAAGRCGLDPGLVTDTTNVVSVQDAYREFTISTGQPVGYYTFGTVRFDSGAQAGQTFTIAENSTQAVIKIFGRTPREIQPGDNITITAGCDRREATCKSFNNFVNFQGFPHVPGRDSTFETPNAK